jgi:murein DD-endopeptidase MepM/ murein hydrolase activator NlpD
VIVRSAYLSGSETKYVDSLYGHLLDFTVKMGQIVKRGQLIGRMGNNRGMYDAHLHFEMRKNIQVGMFRNSFPRDYSVYWDPTQFIAAHRSLPGGGRTVSVPVNTFPNSPPPLLAGKRVYTPAVPVSSAGVAVAANSFIARARSHAGLPSGTTSGTNSSATPPPVRTRRPEFRVKRFEDMRILGYD